jgi:hypothetical protein
MKRSLFNLRYCSANCLACEKPRQTLVKIVPRRVSKHGYFKHKKKNSGNNSTIKRGLETKMYTYAAVSGILCSELCEGNY